MSIPKLNTPPDVSAKEFSDVLQNFRPPPMGPLRNLQLPTRLTRNVDFARGGVAVPYDLNGVTEQPEPAFNSIHNTVDASRANRTLEVQEKSRVTQQRLPPRSRSVGFRLDVRRRAELVSQIGVDEKAFRKGHSYLTLVNDLVRGRVLHVAEDLKQSTLLGFRETLTEEQIGVIEAVAMDMWDPYLTSVREHVPEADGKIVFDKFHVAKHLGDAVDKMRRKENKTLKAAGDDRLAGTRYDWLRNPAPMEARTARNSPHSETAN